MEKKSQRIRSSTDALLRKKALQFLGRREHTRDQLKKKLLCHGDADKVHAVLNSLEASDLLSASRYVEDYIRTRVRKLYGPKHIGAALRCQGLTDEAIEHGLRAAEIDWLECARRFYQKKFSRDEPNDKKERYRRIQALYRRGYDEETIRALMAEDT